MNNVNLDVMSIFNLHFFTVSIQDLPSSEVDFADTDEDGFNSFDECPLIPEDIGWFEDEDGCPEQDNDEDGIADLYDACPNIKGYQKDGCPSTEQQGEVASIDIDNDGIPNSFDQCPNEPETINNYNDYDGCPDTIPEELKELIGIQTAIQFETNTAKLTNESTPELEKIVRLLKLSIQPLEFVWRDTPIPKVPPNTINSCLKNVQKSCTRANIRKRDWEKSRSRQGV